MYTLKIGIDVGGTFTDLIIYDSKTKKFTVAKVPTTTDNPETAILTTLYAISKKPKNNQNKLNKKCNIWTPLNSCM